ncbi:alkylated DNA repair dioxygenase AlkB [Mucilaginibacter yixingensis]|uniref:Alkylated DNA repair dioxygenase AlkB n=1 Tax=Mucilaginibacter yixingensis TaxID=1295612 RepID=A0A2T5JE83_9SPHI|nr:alpha-ketoglutarate-dependent dioxygenase AlkB [Mucilaginibacter yixingensis]PTR00077.1 alkylated DNA repair dioxygenase AlkB [Mucilaginibacter yixingensis]
MTQTHLLAGLLPNSGLPEEQVDYRPGVFSAEESRQFMAHLIHRVPWQQKSQLLYGKEVITPRLTACYGNPDVDYSLTGKGLRPLAWTPELLQIKDRIEPFSGAKFDSVLLNYYRDGNDSVSWHTDNDGVPGKNWIVASVSFGQARRFEFRLREDHRVKYTVELENGSYLLMKGGFQEYWQHRVPKSKQPMQARINLTFRVLHRN